MNKLLQQTEQQILAKAHPKLIPVIQQVVETGKKFMYDDQTRALMVKQLSASGDPEDVISEGVAKLAGILFNESKKTVPMQVLIPASTILLCEALDLLEQAGKVKITPEFLAACTKSLGANVLKLFGITPDKLQSFVDKAQQNGAISSLQGGKQAAPQAQPAPAGLIAQARQGGAA